MSSVIEQYVREEAKKAADAEREKIKKQDLLRARKLYISGKLPVTEIAELFNVDEAEILKT